jgi:uncharacterized phage protein (predicted DNA packaging)
MKDSEQGVTLASMQEYLNLDSDMDTGVIQQLISMAEDAIRGAIDGDIAVEAYRKYSLFNQAVRVLVDFNYYARGTLSDQQLAYPPSYLYMVNSIRWKIRRDERENGSQSTQPQD